METLTNMKRLWIVAVLLTAGLGAGAVRGQQGGTARGRATASSQNVQLEAAVKKEVVDGDVKAAIELYRALAKSSDRALAAQALFRMAGCHAKLGDAAEAQKIYSQIVREFADQTSVVAEAQTKIASSAQKGSGLGASQVWDRNANAVSPDGQYLMFFDGGNMVLHEVSSGRNRVLTRGDAGAASYPVPSPDSRLIAYMWSNKDKPADELRVISRDGGAARVVYPHDEKIGVMRPHGWSPDGKSIVVDTAEYSDAADDYTREFAVINVSDGTKRLVKRFEATDHVSLAPWRFRASPDGRFMGYDRPASPGKPERDLFSLAIDSGREVRMLALPSDDQMIEWFPESGRILFQSDRGGQSGIWAVRVVDGLAQGEPTPILPDHQPIGPLGFTNKGDFYYVDGVSQDDVYLATVDPATGKLVGSLARLPSRYTGLNTRAAWSPKGDKIVYVRSKVNLAILTMSTGVERVVPTGLKSLFNPAWFADGGGVVFQAADLGSRFEDNHLTVLNAETGVVTPLGGQNPSGRWPVSSRDGHRLFYIDSEHRGIVSRELGSGAEQVVSGGGETIALSPDGQWLALRSSIDRVESVSIIPSAGGKPRPLAPVENGWSLDDHGLDWSADGRFVFVAAKSEPDRSRAGEPTWAIWRVPVDGTAPRDTGIRCSGRIPRISAHPDGRRLALSTEGSVRTTWVLQNIPLQLNK
jgi:Tol biopolymer transport system component